MKKIIILLVFLVACDQSSTTTLAQSEIERTDPKPPVIVSIDRTIKRVPLGDSRLVGQLQDEWMQEDKSDLLTELVESNHEIALMPLTAMAVLPSPSSLTSIAVNLELPNSVKLNCATS